MPSYAPVSPWRNIRVLTVAASVLLLILSSGLFFYLRSKRIMENQLKEKLRSTAAVAALSIDPVAVKKIRGHDSLEDPALQATVSLLRRIRGNVPGIRFVYLMRRTEDPGLLEFIADADTLSSDESLDLDGNGVVDVNERPSYPGDTYEVSQAPALESEAFLRPTVDDTPTEDQWGRLISGYAPIWDKDGNAVAVLGMDMDTQDFLAISQSVFSPVALLLVMIGGLSVAGYVILYVWKKRMEALQELEAERSALMNLALHQLGAPLATFKWWLEILREREGVRKCKKEDICLQLDEGIARMDSIMQALCEANKVREASIAYKIQDASLREIIEKEVAFSRSAVRRCHQKIAVSVNGNIDHIRLDKKLIGGVVREFLENAITYSPPGSAITVRATTGRKNVKVEVIDHGIGVSLKDLPRIFEKFTRSESALKMKPVGNGLGLFIAKGIIERAGGKVGVDSRQEKGSTFWFTLPL